MLSTSKSMMPALLFALMTGVLFSANHTWAQAPVKSGSKKAPTKAAPPVEEDSTSSLVKSSGAEPDTSNQGETLKFNTDTAPANTDRHQTMQFKDSGDAPLGSPRPEYAESVPEETPFKSFIGYPKHQLGIYVKPMSLASNWTYQSNTYNFTSPSTGIGLTYRLQVTPLWNMEIDYIHYTMSLDAATVAPYKFLSSDVKFDDYSIKGNYCFVGKATFYRQFCPGLIIGNEGYPILNFVTSSNLVLSKVQDFIVGVNLAYQEPFSDNFLFKLIGGYNYGTGLGNSGYLTSKSNSSYYADAGAEWNVTEHNTVLGFAEFRARSANVNGVKGSVNDTWTTTSSLLGFKLGYMRTF